MGGNTRIYVLIGHTSWTAGITKLYFFYRLLYECSRVWASTCVSSGHSRTDQLPQTSESVSRFPRVSPPMDTGAPFSGEETWLIPHRP